MDKPRKNMVKPFHPIMLQRLKPMLSLRTGCKNTQREQYNYSFGRSVSLTNNKNYKEIIKKDIN